MRNARKKPIEKGAYDEGSHKNIYKFGVCFVCDAFELYK